MSDVINGSSVNLTGYVYYNGWTFKPPRFTWKIRMKPDVSADGRTTLGNTYTLELRAIVTDDIEGLASHKAGVYSGAASELQKQTWTSRGNIQKIRSMLSKNGGHFKIFGLGFDIELNTHATGSLFDTRWGPKTTMLEIQPVGNGVVWEVFWVCEFTVPECVLTNGTTAPSGNNAGTDGYPDFAYISFPYNQGDIEGLTFTTNFTIDPSGLTTRVIQGIVSIAINRAYVNDPAGAWNKVSHVADEVREKISPAIPENFQRIHQAWETSDDRRFLRFQIVDKELPGENAYPEGVINMSLNHTVSSSGSVVAASSVIVCQFQGHVEVMKGWPLATAFDKCLLIMQQRINYAIQQERDATGDDEANPVTITAVQLTEALYGPRRLSFSVTYMIWSTNKLAVLGNYIKRTAMFLEVDVTDVTWVDWSNSLGGANPASKIGDQLANIGKPWSHRGISGLEFTAEEDRIVGPCEGPGGTVLGYGVNPLPTLLGGGSLVTKCPGKKKNYLMWDNEIKIIHDAKMKTHYPMTAKGAPPTTTEEIKTLNGTATLAVDYRETPADRKTRSQSSLPGSIVIVCFYGRGARIGSWPELPKIAKEKLPESYSDNTITKIGPDIIKHKRYGKIGPCSVFASQWEICYEITNLTAEELKTLLEDIEEALIETVDDTEGEKVDGKDPTPTPP